MLHVFRKTNVRMDSDQCCDRTAELQQHKMLPHDMAQVPQDCDAASRGISLSSVGMEFSLSQKVCIQKHALFVTVKCTTAGVGKH